MKRRDRYMMQARGENLDLLALNENDAQLDVGNGAEEDPLMGLCEISNMIIAV